MVIQDYEADFSKAYVTDGNSAILKCEIPSFVADFVTVESWINSDQNEYFVDIRNNYGSVFEHDAKYDIDCLVI